MQKLGMKGFATLLVAFTLLFASLNVSATVMLYVDVPRLVELSDVVVQGRIIEQQTFMDETAGNVVTETTVLVTENFLGAPTEKITFRQWGGEFDGKLGLIPGDAKFEPYEDVVLFLNRGKHGHEVNHLYLTAMGQSKFTIFNDGRTVRAVRDLHGLSFMNPVDNSFEHRDSEVFEHRVFVQELKTHIQTIKGGAK